MVKKYTSTSQVAIQLLVRVPMLALDQPLVDVPNVIAVDHETSFAWCHVECHYGHHVEF
jgi:hypothetical protein